MKVVLQKFIADSGLCSRRQAEELIRLGRATVNGRLAELGMRVSTEDEVKVNGKKIGAVGKRIYIKLNKPVGYASTSARVKGEKNVFDLVKSNERLFIVGRLDKNSRGLILLTNDGELAQQLAHPRFEHEKKYVVTISHNKKAIPKQGIEMVRANFLTGFDIGEGDGVVKAKAIKYLGTSVCHSGAGRNPEKNKTDKGHSSASQTNTCSKFEVILTYGKKRQIRRMFKALSFEVVDLMRTRIGTLELGGLKESEWKNLNDGEIKKLKSLIK